MSCYENFSRQPRHPIREAIARTFSNLLEMVAMLVASVLLYIVGCLTVGPAITTAAVLFIIAVAIIMWLDNRT